MFACTSCLSPKVCESFIGRQRSSIWFTVFVCGVSLFTDTYLYSIAVPILPFTLIQHAGVREEHVQTWISILLAMHGTSIAIGSVICARWADRTTSYQWPYLSGLVGLVGATVILYFANSVSLLAIGRVLQGLSGGVAWTVPLAIVTNRVSRDRIGPALGYMTLGRSAGMAAGPLFGGVIFDRCGYNAVYVSAFIVVGTDIILRLVLVVEPTEDICSSRPPEKVLLPTTMFLLSTPRMWTAVLGSFQSSLVLGSLDSVLPRFVNQMYGWNSIQAGAAFLAFVGPCIFSPTVGQLTHRYGARRCAVWGYTGAGVFLGLIGAAARKQTPFQALLLVMLCLSGVFILFAEISSWVDAVTAAEIQALQRPQRFRQGFLAHVYGLTNIMFALGFVVGPIGAGFVYQRFGWIAVALLLGIGTIACSLPTIIWMERVTIAQEPQKVIYQEPEIA